MTRRRRIVLIAASFVLTIALLAVGSVAMLTQTDGGRAFIVKLLVPTLDAAVPGRLYVGRMSGNLFNDIRFDSLDIREPNGTPVLSTGPIRVVFDPRDLLDRRVVIKSLEIDRPVVNLVDYGKDDWGWKRALMRQSIGPRLPRRAGALGDYIVIDSVTLREITLTATLPWALSDTLHGAKRDSALAYNLTRIDGRVRRDGDRLVRDWRFERGFAVVGRARLADPDSAGVRLDVKRLDAIWVYPPFWFRNVSGAFRQLGDSIWFDAATLELANSRGSGAMKFVWGSKLPMRYDLRIEGDSVSLVDLAFIDESLPRSGQGSMSLHIINNPRDLSIIEYRITNMDAHALRSHLTGAMTFGVGGPTLRVTDVDLELQPAHTDLLEQFNGEPFPYDWQGEVRGHVTARGGPVQRFVIDNATLSYHDAHVRGAVSSGSARGMVDIFTPAEAILHGVDLRINQLDLRTPRFVNPLFPELNGVARGTMRLDSLWYDAVFSNADIEHVDGPGLPSRFTGSGNYTLLPEGVRFQVDLQAAPLSYTTMSRSYPGLPLRGSAVGRIVASGMAEDFSVNAILAGEGGELAFDGRADAFEPSYRATGTFRMRGVNLQSLFEVSTLPPTTLSLNGTMDISGADLATLRGPLSATVDQFSRVADARLFGATVRTMFDSGHMRVDSLVIESSALRLQARGGLGLVANRTDTLGISMTVDSLGGLRPWIAPADRKGLLPATDTLRGTIDLRALLSGTLDTTTTSPGLSLGARADATALGAGRTEVSQTAIIASLHDLLRRPFGKVEVTSDSAIVGAFAISSGVATLDVENGVARRFSTRMRTPSDVRLALTGGVSRLADTNTIVVDTLDITVPSDDRARGFSLLTPAIARIVDDTTGRLDSLVLVHSDTGRLAVRGGIAAGGGINGRLEVDRVPLFDLGQLFHAQTVRGGSVSLDASIRGTRQQPVLSGTLALRDALIGAVRLAAVDATTVYDSLRLQVDGSLLVGGRRALEARGVLPLDLALVPGRTRLVDAPLQGRIISRDADLSLAEAVLPMVREASGKLETDVELTGTWKNPRLRGQLSIAGGAMTLDNLGIRLERAHADIALAGDTVRIRSLSASSGGPTDTLGLSGMISIAEWSNPSFNLLLSARNFLAIDKPRQASLTVTTTRPISLFGSQAAATVRGALRVDRGRIYINALTQRRGLDLADNFELVDTSALGMNALLPNAPSSLLQNLSMDNVTVEVGEDVWLRSPEANIKLGGALRVTRSLSRDRNRSVLALSDSLTVERGTYSLLLGIVQPRFEVERGVVRFFGDPDLEPALDVTALHTIRELRPNSNRQDIRIRVSIGGTTSHPTLSLSSADNPPIPESDLLSYLVTGEPAYALLGSSYSDQSATLLIRFASSWFSRRLAGGPFDVVQVEPTSLTPGDATDLGQRGLGILAQVRVGVGRQIARNTYVNFSTGLCGIAPQTGSDPLSLFAQGLGVRVERRFERGLSAAIGVEPGSTALACGRPGLSRTFQQTPPQFGFDFFRNWTF